MEEISFKPRYSFSHWFEIFNLFFWMSIMGLNYFFGGQLFSWSLAGFITMAGTILFTFSNMIRRILFLQNALVIEYFLRPRREIEYREISDMSEGSFWAGKYKLYLKQFSNREEFLGITNSIKKSGRISESQLDGKLKNEEETGRWAGIIAIFGTILSVMTVPFILLFWFPSVKFDLGTIIEGSFVGIFLIAFAVLKIRGAREG